MAEQQEADMVTKSLADLTQIGKITRLVGSKVEAVNTQVEGVRVLEVGDPIYLHDTITTSANTFATITLNDHTIFQLGPESRATLNVYQYDKHAGAGELDANLLEGLFRFISGGIAENKEGQHSILHTPAAKIGVRGSELDISIADSGDTTILHTLGFIDVATDSHAPFSVFHPQTRIHIAMANDHMIETALLSESQFGLFRAWSQPLSPQQFAHASLQEEDSVWVMPEPEPAPMLNYAQLTQDTDMSSVPLALAENVTRRLNSNEVLEPQLRSTQVNHEVVEAIDPEMVAEKTAEKEDKSLYLNHRPVIQLPIQDTPLVQLFEDQSLRLRPADFLSFAHDVDGDALSLSQVSLFGVNGSEPIASLEQAELGDVLITPAPDASGLVYLQYQVSDSQGWQSEVAVVPVLINAVNDPPVVEGALQIDISADQNASISSKQILAQVNDPENHDLSLIAFQDAAYNTYQQGVVNDGSGNQWQILNQEDEILGLMLNPNPYYQGSLFVQALVIDLPNDGTPPAPVLVPIEIRVAASENVQQQLIASDDHYYLQHLSTTFNVVDFLKNDQYDLYNLQGFEIVDVNGGEAIYDSTTQTLLFSASELGLSASIDYQIQDLWGQTATARIQLDWYNQAPVAVDDVLYLPANGESLIPVAQLLANDIDSTQDRLGLAAISDVINGQISPYNATHLLFQPDANFASQGGAFQYQAQDSFLELSQPAQVQLQVLEGSFLNFGQDLSWNQGQTQIALLQGAQVNQHYLNLSDQPVLALTLNDPNAGQLELVPSGDLLLEGKRLFYADTLLAQMAQDHDTGQLLLQFNANISSTHLNQVLDSVYFSPLSTQSQPNVQVHTQLYADLEAWLNQSPALDKGSERLISLSPQPVLADDVVEIAFASPERIALDKLLGNDQGEGLSIKTLSDISPALSLSLEAQHINLFVDNSLIDSQAGEAIGFRYHTEDAYGNLQSAAVTLEANNIQQGDDNDNRLIGDMGVDILKGESGDDYLQGLGGDDSLYGGPGADVLDGGKGYNQLFAGFGDDVIQLHSDKQSAYIDGGAGFDSLQLQGSQLSLDLVANRYLLPDQQLQLYDIERIDLNSGHNQIVLQPEDILDMNQEQQLLIEGLNGSVISVAADWQYLGEIETNDASYDHYSWQNQQDMGEQADLFVQSQLNQFIF